VKTEATPKKNDGRKRGPSSSRKPNNKKASSVSSSSSSSSKDGGVDYAALQNHHQGISSSCSEVGQQQHSMTMTMTMIDFHGVGSNQVSSQVMVPDLQTTSCSSVSSNSGSTYGSTSAAPAPPVVDNMTMMFNRAVTAGFSDHILHYKDDIIDLFGRGIVG
jgi:hypothetical protein